MHTEQVRTTISMTWKDLISYNCLFRVVEISNIARQWNIICYLCTCVFLSFINLRLWFGLFNTIPESVLYLVPLLIQFDLYVVSFHLLVPNEDTSIYHRNRGMTWENDWAVVHKICFRMALLDTSCLNQLRATQKIYKNKNKKTRIRNSRWYVKFQYENPSKKKTKKLVSWQSSDGKISPVPTTRHPLRLLREILHVVKRIWSEA